MRKIIVNLFIFAIISLSAYQPQFMKDPAISQDGETICFNYNNDLWLVSFEGGKARRITDSEYNETGPIFSPNGKFIAFNSNRGFGNSIYIIPIEGGKSRKIFDSFTAVDWFNDSKYILAEKSVVGEGTKLYKVSLKGNRPEEICEMGNYFSSLSANNEEIIFNRRGKPFREAYKGSTNGELWIYNIEDEKFRRMTNTLLTERYPKPAYTKDGYYFGASDGEIFQLYFAPDNDFSKREKLTSFKEWSVRDIDVARKNDRIVFECFDKIGTYEPATNKTNIIEIEINEDKFRLKIIWENVKNKFDDYAVSTNGKFVAFIYKYDLFVMPTEGGEVKQITFDQKYIEDIKIIGEEIYFIKYADGANNLFSVNINNLSDVKQMKTMNKLYADWLSVSQENLIIHFSDKEARDKVYIYNPETKKYNKSFDKTSMYNVSISPDSSMICFTITNRKNWNRKLFVADFNGNMVKEVYHSENYITKTEWAPDNHSIFFTESGKILRIDLVAITDFRYKKDNWKEILKSKDTKLEHLKYDQIEFENIENRIQEVIKKDGYNVIVKILKDSTLIFSNSFDGEDTIWETDLFGKKPKKISSALKNSKNLRYNPKSKYYYYLSHNNLKRFKNKKIESVENKFYYEYDTSKLNRSLFNQVWTEFGMNFYDKNMHEKDWKSLKKKYEKYITDETSLDDIESIVDEMIGEVNASHTGFYPRKDDIQKYASFGYLGCTFDYSKTLSKGIKIEKVFQNSKLAQPFNIKENDILLEIDGERINSSSSVKHLLRNKIGRTIELKINSEGELKLIKLIGLSYSENRTLQYENWVNEREEKVKNLADDTIEYMHIRSMDQASLKKFRHEFYTISPDIKGLIIDVRNNSGGRIHD
ncbi:MAG: PDZ domain-containing protein, partial [Candidatus Cloacimonadota bacterium]|nr:PDZ domain-containing protein [Candidatus Cloacimonadota bacterium]